VELYKKVLVGVLISVVIALGVWVVNQYFIDEEVPSRARKVFWFRRENIEEIKYG
jgi:hypothetical protein